MAPSSLSASPARSSAEPNLQPAPILALEEVAQGFPLGVHDLHQLAEATEFRVRPADFVAIAAQLMDQRGQLAACLAQPRPSLVGEPGVVAQAVAGLPVAERVAVAFARRYGTRRRRGQRGLSREIEPA